MKLFQSGRRMVYELRNSNAKIHPTMSAQDLYALLKAAFIRLDFQISAVSHVRFIKVSQ